MNWIISHETALEYWRAARRNHVRRGSVVRTLESLAKPPDSRALGQVNQRQGNVQSDPVSLLDMNHIGLSEPLNILVGDTSDRKSSKKVVCHVWVGPYPRGCFIDVGNGLLVSSPALCFLQMATRLSRVALIELGYELCSSYCVADEAVGADEAAGAGETSSTSSTNSMSSTSNTRLVLQPSDPLTTPDKMQSLIAKVGGTRGTRGSDKASKALEHVAQGSASPMETKLAMLLSLPNKRGGYGLPKPLLNERIAVGPQAKKASGKSHYVCDLYWPSAKLAVEYDSDTFHTGAERIASDAQRRNALAYLGITVVTVTRKQIYNPIEFNKVAHLLAKTLGKRLRYDATKFYKKQRELRDLLL